MKQIIMILIIAAVAYGSTDDYESGRMLYNDRGCSNCHGTNAEGSGNFPKLANRSKGYLLSKLKQYKEGRSTKQSQQMMFGFARSLNDKEMDEITTFLSNYKEESNERYELDYEIIGGDN